MIVLFKLDDLLLIKIADNKYYYGNGESINSISFSANTFLRFNPYLEDADRKTKIPSKIKKWIKEHADVPTIENKLFTN